MVEAVCYKHTASNHNRFEGAIVTISKDSRRPWRIKDITGQRSGWLTVESHVYTESGSRWLCRCVCGKTVTVDKHNLRNGHAKSCGCRADREEHGKGKTIEYFTWSRMVGRCYNTKSKSYPKWGGRGITVCDRWRQSFLVFLADMGERPSSRHSLDRINNDGNYEPGNCRWATRQQQAQNRRSNVFVDFRGESVCLEEFARQCGVCSKMFHKKIRNSGRTAAMEWALSFVL